MNINSPLIFIVTIFYAVISCKNTPPTIRNISKTPDVEENTGDSSVDDSTDTIDSPGEIDDSETLESPDGNQQTKIPTPGKNEVKPVVKGKTVPVPVSGQGASAFQITGESLLDKIIKDFRVDSLGLYAEAIDKNSTKVDGSGGVSFVWPASHVIRALRSASMVNPGKYQTELYSYSKNIERYKHGERLTASIDANSDPYFDDNAIVGESLLDAARRVGDNGTMASLGKMGLDYCFNAKDASYGVPQLEKQLNWGMYYSQTTILPALGAVKYGLLKNDGTYIDLADAYYKRSKDPATGLLNNEGLYNQYSFIRNGKASMTTPFDPSLNGTGVRAYQSTPMVQLALYLSLAKNDETYLKDAQSLAELILKHFYQAGKGINEISYWGGSDVVEMLLDLYEVDQNVKWLNTARDIVRFLAEKGRDTRGYYASTADGPTGNWNVDRRQVQPEKIEIMGQAAAATAFLRVAYCDIFCPAKIANGSYVIRNTLTGKVLTNFKDGVTTSENTGSADQIWTFSRQADGSYAIKAKSQKNYLSVKDTAPQDGSVLESQSNILNENKKFLIINKDTQIFRIVQKASRKSLDGGPESAIDKAPYLWSVSDVANQYWTLEPW